MDSINDKIQEHEGRIVNLESSEKEFRGRLSHLERDIHQLENTIINENRETRLLFQGTMDKQWDLIKSRDEAAGRDKEREYNIKKTKLERNTELLIKLLGAGGLIYLCIQSILDMISK